MRRVAVHCLVTAVGSAAIVWCGAAPAAAQGTPITNQTRQALEFYGGHSAYRTLNDMPRRTAIQPNSNSQISYNGKPFQSAHSSPTVSPYLNLFRDETERSESVPTYYSFVRPQLEAQAASEQQQREIQGLQRQFQTSGRSRTAFVPGAGAQARYMDTAQFYGGWQR
jgi:hypothetical protein